MISFEHRYSVCCLINDQEPIVVLVVERFVNKLVDMGSDLDCALVFSENQPSHQFSYNSTISPVWYENLTSQRSNLWLLRSDWLVWSSFYNYPLKSNMVQQFTKWYSNLQNNPKISYLIILEIDFKGDIQHRRYQTAAISSLNLVIKISK